MKRYQIALLFFAVGIFVATFVFSLVSNNKLEKDGLTSGPDISEYSIVKVFFSSNQLDPGTMYCERTYPVERGVRRLTNNDQSALGELAYLALAELLKGPSETEKSSGYFTSINTGTKIQKITIEDGIATIDFSALGGNEPIAGSCRVQAIRSQITETLKQFPEVKDVVISVNGESQEILQP